MGMASSHCIKDSLGCRNRRTFKSQTQGMTGHITDSSVMMDIKMTHYTKSGEQGITFKLTNVIWNLNFNYNLFSASRCLKDGWTMRGSSNRITMTSPDGQHHIAFDQKLGQSKEWCMQRCLIGWTVWESQVRKLIS